VLVLRTRAYNRAGGVDPLVRLKAAADAFELAEASGDHEAAALALFLGMTGRLVTGEIHKADQDAEVLKRRVEEHRLLQVEPFLLGYRATRALMSGRFQEAERLAVETAELGRRVSSPVAALYFGVPQLGELRRAQGRAREIASLFADAPARFPDQVGFLAPIALMRAEAGEEDEARGLFRRAEALGFASLPIDANRLTLLSVFAETAAHLGERQAATSLYELAVPHAGRFAAAGHAQAFLGPVSSALGLLADLAGWNERADAHFAAAIEAIERVGSPPLLARTRFYWARALARRKPRAGARMSELLWEAVTTARPLGMQGIVDAAERLRGETAARRLSRGRP
jgi:tetratricopeptide (TPR) repeat protein